MNRDFLCRVSMVGGRGSIVRIFLPCPTDVILYPVVGIVALLSLACEVIEESPLCTYTKRLDSL